MVMIPDPIDPPANYCIFQVVKNLIGGTRQVSQWSPPPHSCSHGQHTDLWGPTTLQARLNPLPPCDDEASIKSESIFRAAGHTVLRQGDTLAHFFGRFQIVDPSGQQQLFAGYIETIDRIG